MAKKWTVMVYMAADNSTTEDLVDLTAPATADLDEMMSVGSNDDLDIVVQVDWKASAEHPNPERLHIRPGGADRYPMAGPINTGSPAELERFVRWVEGKGFSSPKTMLVLWG